MENGKYLSHDSIFIKSLGAEIQDLNGLCQTILDANIKFMSCKEWCNTSETSAMHNSTCR